MGLLYITMPRGDIKHVCFTIKDSEGKIIDTAFAEVYFTVKQSYTRNAFLFQKKLSDQTITFEDGVYSFTIDPEDTNNLSYGAYVFDIQVSDEGIKQTIVGKITITEEVTFAENE